MLTLDLHCKIDEDVFSWTMFLTRLLIGGILLYVAAGGLLYYREFLYNAAALGWPLPVQVGISLLLVQVLLALMLMLGWFTRLVSGFCVLCMGAVGFIFFATDLNRIFLALMGLLITALLPSVLLGPGKISLDYKQASRHASQVIRG